MFNPKNEIRVNQLKHIYDFMVWLVDVFQSTDQLISRLLFVQIAI